MVGIVLDYKIVDSITMNKTSDTLTFKFQDGTETSCSVNDHAIYILDGVTKVDSVMNLIQGDKVFEIHKSVLVQKETHLF